MNEMEQAEAYARADFEEPHGNMMKMFDKVFPNTDILGNILDLGCGPGDIGFRCAYRFPKATIIGIDGAAAMVQLAEKRKRREQQVGSRTQFIQGVIPGAPIPAVPYELIISNSLLHHLHHPEQLWQTIQQYSSPGTKIFVVDLFRPPNKERAHQFVKNYMANEPKILQRDFYNSLLAAFEPQEVENQLIQASLPMLTVSLISDRHLMVFGEIA